MTDNLKIPPPLEIKRWAEMIGDGYATPAARTLEGQMVVFADSLGPTPPPPVVDPRFNLRTIPFNSIVPSGIYSNSNWNHVNGVTRYKTDGSVDKMDMMCLEFVAPSENKAGSTNTSNYGDRAVYAICETPGGIKRNAAPSEFGGLSYGTRFWNTQPGIQQSPNLIPGMKYYLCVSFFNLEIYNTTGDITVPPAWVRPGGTYNWSPRFNTRIVA